MRKKELFCVEYKAPVIPTMTEDPLTEGSNPIAIVIDCIFITRLKGDKEYE